MVSFIDVFSSNLKPVLEDYRKLEVAPIELKFSKSGVVCRVGSGFELLFVYKKNPKCRTSLLRKEALREKWCTSGNAEAFMNKAHCVAVLSLRFRGRGALSYAHCFRDS